MTAILEFKEVDYSYPGQSRPALDKLTVAFPKGKRIAILGHNGSGKSTLFLHANGIFQPNAGTVLFEGQPISYKRKDIQELRRQVGIVFQQADDQLFSASVAQDISFGPLNLGLSEAEARERVEVAAQQCHLTALLERPTHALSGGEKARAALAGILAMEPELILIDEPTASLDPPMRRQIFTIFHQLHLQGKTIIIATHEIEVARYWADFVVVLESGRAIAAEPPEILFDNHALLAQTGLDEPWYEPLKTTE